MTMYRCTDGLSTRTIDATNPTEAARLYVGPSEEWRKNGYDDDAVDIDVTEICHDPADEFTSHIKITLDDVYRCYPPDTGEEVVVRANDSEDAAEECFSLGDWDPEEGGTIWVNVRVVDSTGETSHHKIQVDPVAPACADGHSHDWLTPIETVGGLAENPGVFGHGGGVTIHEVCPHCGWHRHMDTWATDPTDGEQGLTSVEYRRDDEEED